MGEIQITWWQCPEQSPLSFIATLLWHGSVSYIQAILEIKCIAYNQHKMQLSLKWLIKCFRHVHIRSGSCKLVFTELQSCKTVLSFVEMISAEFWIKWRDGELECEGTFLNKGNSPCKYWSIVSSSRRRALQGQNDCEMSRRDWVNVELVSGLRCARPCPLISWISTTEGGPCMFFWRWVYPSSEALEGQETLRSVCICNIFK